MKPRVNRAFLTAALLALVLSVLAAVGTPSHSESEEVVYVLDVSRSHGPAPDQLLERLRQWHDASALAAAPYRVVQAGKMATFGDVPAPPGQEEGSPQNLFEKHVEAMLQEIPWVVGNREDKTTPPEVAGYDVGAAELRADELQRLASGQEPPDLKSLKELRMPPPRARTQQQSLLEADQPLR